jgi:hypothetical protein
VLVCRDIERFDCLLDCGLLIRLVVNDADELGGRPLEVIDAPGMACLVVVGRLAIARVVIADCWTSQTHEKLHHGWML